MTIHPYKLLSAANIVSINRSFDFVNQNLISASPYIRSSNFSFYLLSDLPRSMLLKAKAGRE